MRIILFIVAALIAAGGTGFYLFQKLAAQPQASAPADAVVAAPKSEEVFVPVASLSSGTILTPENLTRMRMDADAVTPQMVVADDAGLQFLVGGVARQSLPEGVPIARAAIVSPGDRGFLAAVLPKGKRAISIPISLTAGLSGLVLPGDRIDIILTYSVSADTGTVGRDIHASETLIQNIRVLALDQRLQSTEAPRDKNGELISPPVAQTATLEVTPRQAEMLILARTLGEMSLVLNSVRDGGDPREAGMGGEAVVEAGLDAMLAPMLRSGPAEPAALDLGPGADRDFTLDTDVTSLLPRLIEDSLDNDIQIIPMNRSMVQVVRGKATNAVEIGKGSPAAPATAAAPAAE
jgi:pilus assembly protein CpaB